ncbi:hypothetical protein VFPPC_10066 [Pochonia chlamydosporia 170]|uniref:Uncharacterized protein n=1 Tax=Pochonia chlamydosporia 170 TaxID=1380566 RepID=A0A179F3N9_METCM|nr:hypothetical protein VFPPC_10066 [Pochonia chlamydosporia 170]OAQ59971.1 hypothetical protein VFPPC_10066 [Pochonia chlamydosporia 170]
MTGNESIQCSPTNLLSSTNRQSHLVTVESPTFVPHSTNNCQGQCPQHNVAFCTLHATVKVTSSISLYEKCIRSARTNNSKKPGTIITRSALLLTSGTNGEMPAAQTTIDSSSAWPIDAPETIQQTTACGRNHSLTSKYTLTSPDVS